jgi:hypothetical protein
MSAPVMSARKGSTSMRASTLAVMPNRVRPVNRPVSSQRSSAWVVRVVVLATTAFALFDLVLLMSSLGR